MRRRQAFKRGRVLSIVVAGFAGYVIGGWNGSVPRSPALSAAQSVALRFPQDLGDASPVTVAFATSANAAAMGNTQPCACSVRSRWCRRHRLRKHRRNRPPLRNCPTPQATMQVASAEHDVAATGAGREAAERRQTGRGRRA